MTFVAYETSLNSGQPVELYVFTRVNQFWRYTNADRDLTVGGNLYTAVHITRTALSQTSEVKKLGLTVTMSRDSAIYDQFKESPPNDSVALTVYTYHYTDPGLELLPEWTGRIVGCARRGVAEVAFVCEPVVASMASLGLRRAWQGPCPHALYGISGCKASKEAFVFQSIVESINALTLRITGLDSFANTHFAGGYVTWINTLGLTDYRGIDSHTTAYLDLSYRPYGLTVDSVIKVYPGCDHTMATCNSKFGNILNFGGTPYIPKKNPYKGDPVY